MDVSAGSVFSLPSPLFPPSLLLIAPSDSSLPLKSEISKQPNGSLGPKSPTDTSVPKYSEDDLQRIFKAVLKAQTPAPALVLAPIVSKVLRKKLKARSPDVYCGKSQMDCYNFCQQCEDYFATARAMGPTWTFFAAFFLWDRISFVDSSTNRDMTPTSLSRSRRTSSRRFFIKVWMTPNPLWILTGESSKGTPSTS